MDSEIRIIKVEDEIAGVLKGKPMTFDEADSGNVNPHFERGTPTDENCQTCVVCFKARLDGFDVMAKPFDNKNTIDGHIMLIYKKDEKIVLYDPQSNDFFSDKDLEQILYTIRRNTIKLINISDCFLNKSVVDYVLEARK